MVRVEGERQKENIFGGEVAYVFPGQGSQFVGMGAELYQESRAAKDVFDQVDQALGLKLSKLIFEGSDRELTDTVNSQPAIMAVSIASLEALKETLGENAPRPLFVAGHSLGEYTSLVASGVLDLSDGVKLVRERGRLMQKASAERPGGMGAILGLDKSTLEEICSEIGVQIANINSPSQIIISGEKIAIARAMDLASAKGAKKTVLLAVSGAFHSRLMKPAEPGLKEAISKLSLQDPQVPIVANSSCEILTTASDVKRELVQGLCSTVQWQDSVTLMVDKGATHFIEFGPGKVLSGLVRQIYKKVRAFSIDSPSSVQNLASDLGL